jgi:glycerate 2-kinase
MIKKKIFRSNKGLKVLLIPNSFKESISAYNVCVALEKGIEKVYTKARINKLPLADGGDGTVEAISYFYDAKIIKQKVLGPIEEELEVKFVIIDKGKTAVIEMALASGLALVPNNKRNPMKTNTYGVGQLIKTALDYNVSKIIVGLGGSSSVDGGIGMAQALGVSFKDKTGNEVGFGGQGLEKISKIDCSNIDKRLKQVEIICACDVKNVLTGKEGAAKVYGPQKGANNKMVESLEKALKKYAQIIKRDIGKDVENIKGAGAAGGLGAGFVAFLNAEINFGFKVISDLINLEKQIKKTDIVITGEGKIDKQSFYGKTVGEVLNLCVKYKKPLICIAGIIEGIDAEIQNNNNVSFFSTVKTLDDKESIMKNADKDICDLAENIFKTIRIGQFS